MHPRYARGVRSTDHIVRPPRVCAHVRTLKKVLYSWCVVLNLVVVYLGYDTYLVHARLTYQVIGVAVHSTMYLFNFGVGR